MVDVVWALKAVEPSDGEKADSGRAIGGAADGAGAIGEAVELSDGEKADSSRAVMAIYWYSPPEQSNTLRPKQSNGGKIYHDF